MVIDDHDVHDDWNISAAWVEEMRELDWWAERECAGLASYWLYQYVGNLSPELLRESELLARVREADDGWEVLREFAANERGVRDGARWSYCRDLGSTRLLVIDSRIGRVLDEERRSMLNEDEWRWLEEHLQGDFDHLLIGTSDPLVLAPALHHAERWGEARRARRLGRRRRAARRRSCAAPPTSITGRPSASRSTGSPGSSLGWAPGPTGARPASITVLSGDVHHAYLAELAYPARRRRAQQHLAGGLLAVSQRARRSRAQDDRPRRLADPGGRLPGARPARRSSTRAGPLAPGRGAVLRQPGGDPEARRPLRAR